MGYVVHRRRLRREEQRQAEAHDVLSDDVVPTTERPVDILALHRSLNEKRWAAQALVAFALELTAATG